MANSERISIVNRVLMRRTARDYALIWFAANVLLCAFAALFTVISYSVLEEKEFEWFRIEWVRRLVTAIVGADISQAVNPTGIASLAYSHPLMWVLTVAFVFTVSSGALSGEMDRGTMDILASLPFARREIYFSLLGVLCLMGLPLTWAIWCGSWVGQWLTGTFALDMRGLAQVTVHLYCVYLFLAAMGLALSAMCARRGNALAIGFIIVFYSLVLSLLCAFWPPAEPLLVTGILNYYKPLPMLLDGAWRWGDMMVLLGGAAAWTAAGLIVFKRRDIHVG